MSNVLFLGSWDKWSYLFPHHLHPLPPQSCYFRVLTTCTETFCKLTTHSLQALETWAGTVYLQSMIMVRVSLSLASWNGGWPHTNMKRMTPRLQISAAQETKSEQHVPHTNKSDNIKQTHDQTTGSCCKGYGFATKMSVNYVRIYLSWRYTVPAD